MPEIHPAEASPSYTTLMADIWPTYMIAALPSCDRDVLNDTGGPITRIDGTIAMHGGREKRHGAVCMPNIGAHL